MSVDVKKLNFSYESKDILKDINLKANNGEFIGILGPNGCGKSTLIKNMLKILYPKSGIINIVDKAIKEYSLKELAKIIGFVPQKSGLSLPLLVEDLLLMGRFSHLQNQFLGYAKEDFDKVNEIMELLDIKHFAKRTTSSLSGGEFQRVLLARALIGEPKILLLDEPTSALDLNYSIEIMKICSNIVKNMNLTFIMVLHDLNLASMFCDKVIMLKNGEIYYQGSPKKLYTKEILKEIYGLNCDILQHNNIPIVVALKD